MSAGLLLWSYDRALQELLATVTRAAIRAVSTASPDFGPNRNPDVQWTWFFVRNVSVANRWKPVLGHYSESIIRNLKHCYLCEMLSKASRSSWCSAFTICLHDRAVCELRSIIPPEYFLDDCFSWKIELVIIFTLLFLVYQLMLNYSLCPVEFRKRLLSKNCAIGQSLLIWGKQNKNRTF